MERPKAVQRIVKAAPPRQRAQQPSELADEREAAPGLHLDRDERAENVRSIGVIRSQLVATVAATVLYLVGVAAAGTVFDLIYTYVLQQNWVLAAQTIVPAVASAVMISPTKTFDQSPPQWVGAAILIGYGIIAGLVGTSVLRRRDIG